jgi:hypothetical protein
MTSRVVLTSAGTIAAGGACSFSANTNFTFNVDMQIWSY